MAAAVYATDLLTYKDMTTVTGIVEPTGMLQLNGSGEVDSDLAIYGTVCVSEAMRKSGLGALVYTGTQPTWTAGETCYFVWFKWFAPNALGTKAQGGLRMLVGNTSANYRGWYVGGSGTYAYGGWLNFVVDPTETGLATQTQGSPNTTYNTIGVGVNCPTQSPAKGNSYTIDIIRYGRGEVRFTNGDLANGYATFDEMAVVNDNPTTGRWGLFQDVGGSYLWKGLMSLGLSGTLVDMRDSNVVINIEDTEMVSTSFNRIEVNNASSNVLWESINISALGTRSKGEFEMIDNAGFTVDTCTFTDMSTFIFQSNAVINNVSFIRCELVTQGGSTIDQSTFDNCTASASVLSTDLGLITDCSFISDGSNHAVELNTVGDGTMDWDNTLEGYVVGVSASPASTSSTGNEAIYVNVGSGTLTINVGAGYTIPSIRTAGATVNVVAGQVTTTITVTDISTGLAVNAARVAVGAFSGGSENYRESVTITNAATTATVTHTAHGLTTGDKVNIIGATLDEYNGIKTITVTTVNAYTYTTSGSPTSPAVGTITSTTIFVDGVTNASGVITDTRSIASSQPIRGRVRRATTGDLYKTSPISATIDNISGLNLNVQMIPDE